MPRKKTTKDPKLATQPLKWGDNRGIELIDGIEVISKNIPLPIRAANGQLNFNDHPEFTPNMTPEEVLRAGSFGGSYFRPINSGITGKSYSAEWKEFEHKTNWFEGLEVMKYVASGTYQPLVNKYRVKSGAELDEWEEKNWITAIDPYGWFQWYCRFYLGRRCTDDGRQISRWKGVCGEKGRWKTNLIGKIVNARTTFDNANVSPVVRQTLQHWGYKLTANDYNEHAKKMSARAGIPFIKAICETPDRKETSNRKRKSQYEEPSSTQKKQTER
eukprot:CFRG2024T1